MVQTPRPPIMANPFVAGIGSILTETGELIKAVLRLGVPKSSIQDKLPHFR